MIDMKIAIFFALISFIFFITSVNAAQIWTSDFTNPSTAKRTFYDTNDTIYLNSDPSAFTATTTLRVYIVNDNNTWVNQTNLTDMRGTYSTVVTDSLGTISKRAILQPTLTVGKFDVVIDVNGNGIYDEGTCGTTDCVYHLTETGFEVLKTPQPVITAAYGSYNPVNHNWVYDPTNNNNVMMNLKLTGDTEEVVKLTIVYLSAFGTGNDKTGISVVKLIGDDNNNGIYDSEDSLKAWGTFFNDDGIANLIFTSSIYLQPNSTQNFLIVYTMSSSVNDGETYGANVLNVEGTGETTKLVAKVSNLPLATSIKTISASPYQTTTTTSVITTTTTVIPTDECSSKQDCKADYCSGKKQYTYNCEYSDQEKRKICTSSTKDVKCCENNDCNLDQECVDYKCKSKSTLFGPEVMIVISIVVVVVICFLTAYLYFKSVRKRPKYEFSEQRYS